MASQEINDKLAEDFEEKMKKYDFVRFVWSDIHGIARSKVVPARHVRDKCLTGIHVFEGNQLVGPRCQTYNEIPTRNCAIMPDLDTLCLAPWACNEKKGIRIGHMLCEAKYEESGEPLPSCTRTMCRRLLDQLKDEFDFTMKCGVEHEFILVDGQSHKPVTDGNDILSLLLFSEFEIFFAEMSRNLYQAGVDVESMQHEFQHGQFELTTKAAHGLPTIDASFVLKEVVKEMSKQQGYVATFMTQPMVGSDAGCSSGMHFNISLTDAQGQNVFGKNTSEMTATFRHFLAGLVSHAPALTALCCPTVNCYRRLHKPWSPHDATWGMDNRAATYRLRWMSTGGSFIESRLPSSAANPYLVATAHMAAGMDGLRRKLELPSEMDPSAAELPRNLEEALVALETDQTLVDVVGSQFVKFFCDSKRKIELEVLEDVDVNRTDGVDLVEERKQYFVLI